MKWYLFTTSACPKCYDAKEWAEKHLPECRIVVADMDDDGYDLVIKFKLSRAPVFVKENTDGTFETFEFNEMM